MNIEKIATWSSVVIVIFGAGAGWATLNSKIDRLSERLERIDENAANSSCLTIVSRQVFAIERGKKEVGDELRKLGDDRGCFRNYDEVAFTGTAWSLSLQDGENLKREQERRAREELERAISTIDTKLGLHASDDDHGHASR